MSPNHNLKRINPECLTLDRMTPEQWLEAKPSQIGAFRGISVEQAYNLRPLSLFKPSPAYAEFMKSISLRELLRAANRAGKTTHAANKLVSRALTKKGMYRAVGVTYQQSIDVISRILFETIPPKTLHPESHYHRTRGWKDRLIRFKNGSEIQIKSYDQDPDAHAGVGLDGVWLDEPPPFDIFDENQSRVFDKQGFMIITLTVGGRPIKYLRKIVEAGERDGTWKQYVVPFSRASCPWYSQEQIDRRIKEAALSPSTFEQRIKGGWEGVTENRTFTGFDSSRHLKGRDLTARSADAFRLGLDHGNGENRQVVCLTGVSFVKGTKRARAAHVYRECKSGQGIMGPPQIAKEIVSMIESLARAADIDPMVIVGRLKAYGDSNAAGLGSSGLYNGRIEEALSDLGYPIRISCPVKIPGARQETEALINALALADGFTVDPTCTLVSDAMNHYTSTEELKDPVDALRYSLYDDLSSSSKESKRLVRG